VKAIILARVSTEDQLKEGFSISAQVERAREYAKRKSLEITSEYQFEESSTKDQRKKFELVVDEIKKSKERIALIVETVDRLQRSFKESVLLDDLRKTGKLDIHFIRENLVRTLTVQRSSVGI
jgi:site-specific DNA recombinase